jgi:glycosyltransferase involved in cell wall biosynthesis
VTLKDDQPQEAYEIFRTLDVFDAPHIWTARGFGQILRMARFFRDGGFDVVHSFMLKSAIASVVAGRIAGVRHILTSRRDIGYYHTPRSLKLMRVLNRLTTRVTANCQAAADAAVSLEGLDPAKIDILYNGVDQHRFDPSRQHNYSPPERFRDLPDRSRVVGMLANYRPVKDYPLFLESAAIVAAAVPDAAFLLIGAGPQQTELEVLSERLGIASRVYFTDGVGPVPFWLQRIGIGCLTSSSEGFSNSILEYMAAGLPVVACDVGGIREAVIEGKTGFLVRDRKPELIAGRLAMLLQNETLRTDFGRCGLESCRNKWTLDVATRQLERYYRTILMSSQGQ